MADTRRENYSKRTEVSVWNWMLSSILLMIPLVNLIMLIVWAVSCKRPSKRNFAIAQLVLIVLIIVAIIVGAALYGQQINQAITWLRNWIAKTLPATTVEPIDLNTVVPMIEATPIPAATVAPIIAVTPVA